MWDKISKEVRTRSAQECQDFHFQPLNSAKMPKKSKSRVIKEKGIGSVAEHKFSLTHLPLEKMAVILADDNFKCIFLNENDRIPIRISLKFVPRSPTDNEPALVQVMAWRRTGDYLNQCWPDSLTHICGTRERWVNSLALRDLNEILDK